MELKSSKDTQKLSKKLSKKIRPGDVILLYGEIGVGKTTFVRFLINQLEDENSINKSEILSPTFNIVYDYKIKKLNILHYDLYRLKNHKDILELGMFETSKNYIKIIEWPELIKNNVVDRLELYFSYSASEEERELFIKGTGKWKQFKLDELQT